MAIGKSIESTLASFSAGSLLAGEFSHLRDALVMIVDDEPLNIEVTQAYLEDAGYSKFVSTSDSGRAIELLNQHQPDVLLLDLVMPKPTGFDILAQIRVDPALKHIPVIVLTSSIDSETKLRALAKGALDFLGKPVDPTELALRLRNTLAVKAHQDYLTYFDALTGLPNRRKLTERLRAAIAQAGRAGLEGAILSVDVDRFRQVNDALGPKIADSLLREVAARIERCLRDAVAVPADGGEADKPAVARFEGDELVVLVPVVPSMDAITDIAQRVLDTGVTPYKAGDRDVFLTVSVGVAVFPRDGPDADSIVKNAGLALKQAKKAGRNCCEFYSQDLNARALQRLSLESSLRRALERNELTLHYQPKFGVKSGQVMGVEMLLRWQHPERGLLSSQKFMHVAEETGLIVPIGEWALRAVCEQGKAWQAAGLRPVPVSVNVAQKQLRHPGYVQAVRDALSVTGQPQHLVLELTETSIMAHPAESIALLNRLHELGLQLSLDDFGTGHSSLSFLSRCPVDELKIDESFIAALGGKEDSGAQAIVGAMVAMAHALDLVVVANGVEAQGQLEFLARINCDACQGPLLGKPVSAEEFAATWMERRRKAKDPASGDAP